METELELIFCDNDKNEASKNDSRLKHQTTGNTTENHSCFCKASHEVEKTRPATEDWDEYDNKSCDPGHVFQLSSGSNMSILWSKVAIVLK